MKYLHYSFEGKRNGTVKVHFDQPAKIMLLSKLQYKNYQRHRTFTYRGGMMEDSPASFTLPADGTWHLVVELGSYFSPKKINASVQLL